MPKIAITAATIEALGAATGGTAALACAGAARRPDFGNRATNQRRTDGALLNGQKFVGSKLVVTQRELGRGLYLQPCAIAIVPFRRGMNFQLARQIDLRCPLERLKKDRRFCL